MLEPKDSRQTVGENVRWGQQEHTGTCEDKLEPTGWTRIHIQSLATSKAPTLVIQMTYKESQHTVRLLNIHLEQE